MSEYTLNDIKFNLVPLTLCPAGQGDNADKDELKKTFQKNRELMERQFNERKSVRAEDYLRKRRDLIMTLKILKQVAFKEKAE